jgi:hypothetical protein
MPYAGILPFTTSNGKVLYLLGREHIQNNWTGSNKWSDFGGATDGDTATVAAGREFYEETMGIIFHSAKEATDAVVKDAIDVKLANGNMFLLAIRFDPELPARFNSVVNYFRQCTRADTYGKKGYFGIPTCPEGLFEKMQAGWFSKEEIIDLQKKGEIRDVFFHSFSQCILSPPTHALHVPEAALIQKAAKFANPCPPCPPNNHAHLNHHKAAPLPVIPAPVAVVQANKKPKKKPSKPKKQPSKPKKKPSKSKPKKQSKPKKKPSKSKPKKQSKPKTKKSKKSKGKKK